MDTIATIIAGLVLAGAATAGVVVTQGGAPSGSATDTTVSQDPAAVYDAGQ
ncbi:MAG: hypothetical protein Q8R60_07235 [Mycobacteriales bacterium]|nr:hypothetical protein [Mycobacteriales bacterium]